MRGNTHVRFGGAGQGNERTDKAATAPWLDSYTPPNPPEKPTK